MFPQRSVMRASQRLASQVRTPAFRSSFQRRFASSESSIFKGVQDNAFNRERHAVKEHAVGTTDLWRKITLYVALPGLLIAAINANILWKEHWEHWAHMTPLEERPEYPYQNVRTKNFFWGDGDKTLFWNDEVNHHKKE